MVEPVLLTFPRRGNWTRLVLYTCPLEFANVREILEGSGARGEGRQTEARELEL